MITRIAAEKDITRIGELLLYVHSVHSSKRPDIFRRGSRKYTDEELSALLRDESYRIFVADEDGEVAGYIFTIIEETKDSGSLNDRKNLYIDDLCVDTAYQKRGVGTLLLNRARSEAKSLGCQSITLNVWELNDGARIFYEKAGFSVMKTVLEEII